MLWDGQLGVGDADRGWKHRQRSRFDQISEFYKNPNFVLNVFLIDQEVVWNIQNVSEQSTSVGNRC